MDQLKIHTLVTKSHESMLNDWFLKTMPVGCKPVVNHLDFEPTEFRKGQWHKIFARKVEMVLDAIATDNGTLIAVSDVDIQFFRPLVADLYERIHEHDIVFQNNACGRATDVKDLCAGFMAVACSYRVRPFFEEARRQILKTDDPKVDDQVVYSRILGLFPRLNIGLLPDSYWTHAKMWKYAHPLNPPKDVILHHANWVVGVEHKIEQLRRVREQFKTW